MSQGRPTRDRTMLKLAGVIAERATCARRKVGCVLTDAYGRILAMGHNGVPRGMQHCTEFPCDGAGLRSGTGLDLCLAVHAEQNALMFCPDIMKVHACYVTVSPCTSCLKSLLQSSCQKIVFQEEYPHAEARVLWKKAGFTWKQLAGSDD